MYLIAAKCPVISSVPSVFGMVQSDIFAATLDFLNLRLASALHGLSRKYPSSALHFFHLDISLMHAFLKDWFGFGYI